MPVRETWVYPADGSEPYLKGSRAETIQARPAGFTVMGDLPDFVSPVDGKLYHGRAGLREHNERNSVVPVEDLKGLPYYTTNSDVRSPEERRASAERRKELLIRNVNKHYR